MHKRIKKTTTTHTSWEPVQKWYNQIVGEDGHYYHQKLIIPGVQRLMNLKNEKSAAVLDLACGQGVLARALPTHVNYCGLDISASFIKEAKAQDRHPQHAYHVADVTKPLPLEKQKFSHASIILAIQNIENPLLVFKNAFNHLEAKGKLVIVLNHPCFRIPRQSSWEIDQEKKIQYRRLDKYGSSMTIPIHAHPSKGQESAATVSFHHPLSQYTKWLHEAGFMIEEMEEWYSDKVSTGKAAKMENRSREEFPLFLTIIAIVA